MTAAIPNRVLRSTAWEISTEPPRSAARETAQYSNSSGYRTLEDQACRETLSALMPGTSNQGCSISRYGHRHCLRQLGRLSGLRSRPLPTNTHLVLEYTPER